MAFESTTKDFTQVTEQGLHHDFLHARSNLCERLSQQGRKGPFQTVEIQLEEILHHQNNENNKINYQPQLLQHYFSHQQYHGAIS